MKENTCLLFLWLYGISVCEGKILNMLRRSYILPWFWFFQGSIYYYKWVWITPMNSVVYSSENPFLRTGILNVTLNSVVSWHLSLLNTFFRSTVKSFVYYTTDVNSVLITKVLIPFSLQRYKSKVILLKHCSYAVGELQVGEPGQVLGDSTVFSTYKSP